MKICEFSEYDMRASMFEWNKRARGRGLILEPSPMERAMRVLAKTLDVVNQAGLDGKRLSDLSIVYRHEPASHPDDQKWEIHAKVTHRLSTPR